MIVGLAKTHIKTKPTHVRRIRAMTKRATQDSTKRCTYWDYMNSNQVKSAEGAKRKIVGRLENIAQYSENYYKGNKEQMREVRQDVWELKPGAHRLLMFQDENTWIITDAFRKPSGGIQNQRIEAAHEDRALYFRAKET